MLEAPSPPGRAACGEPRQLTHSQHQAVLAVSDGEQKPRGFLVSQSKVQCPMPCRRGGSGSLHRDLVLGWKLPRSAGRGARQGCP